MYIIKRDASACADMCERKVVQEGRPHSEMNNRIPPTDIATLYFVVLHAGLRCANFSYFAIEERGSGMDIYGRQWESGHK